jgi:cell wall-associated NlpC family hydrolase
MTFSGIAAIQAQIQAIEQQVGAVASPGTAATAGSGSTTGSDFASLLTDAMNTQTAVDAGNIGDSSGSSDASSSSTSGSSTDLSSLLGEAGALTGSGNSSALDPTSSNSSALSSLVSGLTGTGSSTSPDVASLLSSLTGASGGSGSTTSPDISSLLAGLTGTGSTGATSTIGGTPNVTTQNFLDAALSQQGKPYVWGAKAPASDANPAAFDCSGLTTWAAARAGVTIPNGAAHQYVWLKEQGATMTVQQALQTPGALLFHFASEPQPGLGGEPPVAHVAISLGNGMTMEAKGHSYGVGVFQAGDRFNYAGMIPGMT